MDATPGVRLVATLAFAAVACGGAWSAGSSTSRPDGRRRGGVVMIFPPVSEPGQGSFAEAVRYSIYRKIKRVRGWEVVDPLTVEEAVEASPEPIGPATPLPRLLELSRQYADADFVVVGSVRGGGRIKTAELRVIDLNAGPPRQVCTRRFTLRDPQDLRFQIEELLKALTGVTSYHRALPRSAERRWKSGKNLVPNGNMELGGAALARWEGQIAKLRFNPPKYDGVQAPISSDQREMIKWSKAPAGGTGRCLHYAMDEAVAASYGLACYSDWIPIQEHATYRFQCRYRTTGPTVKVFIKGYDRFHAKDGTGWQRREVYRRQVHPKGPKGQWNTTTADFVPRHDKTTPRWVRIDLYAYWPKGHVWFDDVVLKKIADPHREPRIDAGRRQLSDSLERVVREHD